MTEQEIKSQEESEEQVKQELPQPDRIPPLKKKIDGVKEEYKRVFLVAGMALMFIYAIYLLYNAFVK